MKQTQVVGVLLAILCLGTSFDASASGTIPMQFCFRYNIDYDDDDASIGDDYFIEVDAGPGSAPKARGLQVRVEDLDADPADPHPFDGYASYNGLSPGCTPVLDLVVDHQILITTWSEALVGGNVITVRESQFHSVTFRDEHAFQETVNQGWPNP